MQKKQETVAQVGEFGLIAAIQKALRHSSPDIIVGLGDDAAIFYPRQRPVVITTDAMVQDVHFRLDWNSPEELAHKALASNLSDLAAKCALPAFGVITLGLPGTTEAHWVEKFYNGLNDCQEKWGIEIIGGDTVSANQIFISITVLGYQAADEPVLNNRAQIGDWVLVTGALGDAAAGLDILQKKGAFTSNTDEEFLVRRFLLPEPRLKEALSVCQTALPNAMTDISDGLARDLKKICEASSVGAKVDAEKVPASPALQNLHPQDGFRYSWKGGEDYELLFTLPSAKAQDLLGSWGQALTPLHVIGEIVQPQHGIQIEGWEGELPSGFDHFKQ